jgi:hypothetical protein
MYIKNLNINILGTPKYNDHKYILLSSLTALEEERDEPNAVNSYPQLKLNHPYHLPFTWDSRKLTTRAYG